MRTKATLVLKTYFLIYFLRNPMAVIPKKLTAKAYDTSPNDHPIVTRRKYM